MPRPAMQRSIDRRRLSQRAWMTRLAMWAPSQTCSTVPLDLWITQGLTRPGKSQPSEYIWLQSRMIALSAGVTSIISALRIFFFLRTIRS